MATARSRVVRSARAARMPSHGVSHATYCHDRIGAHSSSAATVASVTRISSRVRSLCRARTTVQATAAARTPALSAVVSVVVCPIRLAPLRYRTGSCERHRYNAPTVLSICHACAPRKPNTCAGPCPAVIAHQPRRPALADASIHTNPRQRRVVANATAMVAGHSLARTAAPRTRPAARSARRLAKASPSTANAMDSRSNRNARKVASGSENAR